MFTFSTFDPTNFGITYFTQNDEFDGFFIIDKMASYKKMGAQRIETHAKSSLIPPDHSPIADNDCTPVCFRGCEPTASTPNLHRRVHFGDTISVITDSSLMEPSLPTSTQNKPVPVKNRFTSLYLVGKIKAFCERDAKEFSISEYLDCTCCLCKLRHKNGQTFEFCIKKHPMGALCQSGQPSRSNNLNICKECSYSMVSVTKKNKQKQFRCGFEPCSHTLKTKATLQKHYLTHLKVKNFICCICEKNYASKSGLKKHERTH